jgi:16S rRNA (cytidine1402-2'-O)-methyltransferase
VLKRLSKPLPSAHDTDRCADGFVLPAAGQSVEPVQPGTLYIVSLPIGCLEDISLRALRVLISVDLIAAEHPAVVRPFLLHYEIDTPIESFASRASKSAAGTMVDRLQSGQSIALVCDAGTPLIADAGRELTSLARRSGVPATSVPGPCAAVAALVLSSAACARFAFDGFPPRTRSDRPEFFRSLAGERRTITLYETRSYLRDTLQRLADTLGPEVGVLVARDLTKPTESLFQGSLGEAAKTFLNPPRGEYVLVISAAVN